MLGLLVIISLKYLKKLNAHVSCLSQKKEGGSVQIMRQMQLIVE